MNFSVEQIKNYLTKQRDLQSALRNLTEENLMAVNPIDTKASFEKNDDNLHLYEKQIGTHDLKEEQELLQRATGGKQGKEWLALNPKWIPREIKENMDTKYEIAYWVNYGDGSTFGWFSVEQIIKWLTTPELQLHTLGGTKEK
jgi:hypothetical protein